jgi:hypothetical protein
MHSVAYNVYPALRSSEIHLRLPSSTREWVASNAAQWQSAQGAVPSKQLFFQDALSRLLRKSENTVELDPIPTPLGNYVLLHGLLQRIHLVRELSLPIFDQSAALPTDELNKLEYVTVVFNNAIPPPTPLKSPILTIITNHSSNE